MGRSRHYSQEEAIERARALLVEAVSGVSQKPRHALDILRYYASERDRLDIAQEVIGGSPEQLHRIMREADTLAFANPERLIHAEGRVDFFRSLVGVFLEAAAKIEREDRWGDLYAQEPEESAFASASAARAGATWPHND